MQSVMESLCRCFGSTPMGPHDAQDLDSLAQTQASTPATMTRPHSASGHSLRKASQWSSGLLRQPMDPKRPRSHKRKRSGSRDEIFRKPQTNVSHYSPPTPNPISRFLSNHPVIAHSLCFATPIKDSHDKEDDKDDDRVSVVSDTSLHNSTAEDTMTSTVYYETIKLAGLLQTSPPMPLFRNDCLQEQGEIQQILVALQKEQELQQKQLHEFVRNNHNPHGRLVVCGKAPSQNRVKKDLFGAKQGAEVPVPPNKAATLAVLEQVPHAVYCSSSNSSEGSQGIVGRRISKLARQE